MECPSLHTPYYILHYYILCISILLVVLQGYIVKQEESKEQQSISENQKSGIGSSRNRKSFVAQQKMKGSNDSVILVHTCVCD